MRVSIEIRGIMVFLTLIMLPTVLLGQTPAHGDACYEFDRRYFHWVGRPPGGGDVFRDSTAIIGLLPETHVHDSAAFAVVPPSMEADSFTVRRWRRQSRWSYLGADSLFLVWRNGLYGPVFRLSIGSDSLLGEVRFTTDMAGAERQPESASAVRMICPAHEPSPSRSSSGVDRGERNQFHSTASRQLRRRDRRALPAG